MPWEDRASLGSVPGGPQGDTAAGFAMPQDPRAAERDLNLPTGNRAWEVAGADISGQSGPDDRGLLDRFPALATAAVLAVMAGAIGGGLLATSDPTRVVVKDPANGANGALEAAVTRIDADVLALKSSLDHHAKLDDSRFASTNERLDKLQNAQAESAAKAGKLSEALQLLRDAPPSISAVEAERIVSKDVTGSIPQPGAVSSVLSSKVVTKAAVPRPPALNGWLLRKIRNGLAVIEGQEGLFEVRVGDPVPGLGEVEAIRHQDGRWAVVTSKGIVVGR
jgi:hypothetical protein